MFRSLILAISFILVALPAVALDYEAGAALGGDVWLTPDAGGHGWFLVGARFPGLFASTDVSALLNTDTLALEVERPVSRKVRIGARATGQARFAGVLIDHFVAGEQIDERGFFASYVHGQVHANASPGGGHFPGLSLGVRKWFFAPTPTSGPELVLPPELLVLEARLAWTLWRIRHHRSISDFHRSRWRVQGWAAGVQLGVDLRDQEARFGIEDPRNQSGTVVTMIRQWARWGHAFHPGLRLEFSQWASWGFDEDDLTRPRVGGMNPYVVPIAGAPWGAFLSERHLVVESRLSVARGRLEFGSMVQAAVVSDPRRDDSPDTVGALLGTGLFLDVSGEKWQLDASAGYSPQTGWWAKNPHTSVMLTIGRSL